MTPDQNLRILPLAFRKGGFDYEQLHRTATCVLYRQSEAGQTVGYEVCHIIRRPASTRTMGGKLVVTLAGEYLPSTEQWGSKAWTARRLDHALRILAEQTNLLAEKAAALATA